MSKELWREEDFKEESEKIDKEIGFYVNILKADGNEFEYENNGSEIILKVGGHEAHLLKKDPFPIKIGETVHNYHLRDVVISKVLFPDMKTADALHKRGVHPI